MRKALLIGISISGYLYELKHISELLINYYGYRKQDITILCDNGQYKLPTYNEIIRELNQIVTYSNMCDEIWIYYSGHGVFGGSIVTHDQNLITKQTIYEHVDKIKCKALVIFDCCNSGTIGSQLEWNFEWNTDNFLKLYRNHFRTNLMNPNIYMLCSCSEYETSKDVYDTLEKIHQGAFTTALLNTLNNYKSNRIKILDLFKNICNEIHNMGIVNQTPTLNCSTSQPNFIFEQRKPAVSIQYSILNNFRKLSRVGVWNYS